jgi:hypothetical protein
VVRMPISLKRLTEKTFVHYDQRAYEKDTLITMNRPRCDFETVEMNLDLNDEWINRQQAEIAFALKHYINVVKQVRFLLRAR